ncbi:hypothetical protein FRB97_002081 [Tulasnella sp. 331]|nr:hypothetical protein FRB97_002081 [Tulasnella sp. 331]KAG8886118.1 hypothetical protein FRB98_001412 [Tulasnella sp. 332]
MFGSPQLDSSVSSVRISSKTTFKESIRLARRLESHNEIEYDPAAFGRQGDSGTKLGGRQAATGRWKATRLESRIQPRNEIEHDPSVASELGDPGVKPSNGEAATGEWKARHLEGRIRPCNEVEYDLGAVNRLGNPGFELINGWKAGAGTPRSSVILWQAHWRGVRSSLAGWRGDGDDQWMSNEAGRMSAQSNADSAA